MAIIHKDIGLLSQKSAVAGTEKLPVSDTEYITPAQITSSYLSKSGGTMSADAGIDIYDSGDPEDYESSTNIYAGGVEVGGEYGSSSISGGDIALNGANGGHAELYASSNDANLYLYPGYNADNTLILRHDGFTHGVGSTEKTWSFPSQSGTFALTSDVPTIHSGTSDPSSSLGSNGDIYIKLSS